MCRIHRVITICNCQLSATRPDEVIFIVLSVFVPNTKVTSTDSVSWIVLSCSESRQQIMLKSSAVANTLRVEEQSRFCHCTVITEPWWKRFLADVAISGGKVKAPFFHNSFAPCSFGAVLLTVAERHLAACLHSPSKPRPEWLVMLGRWWHMYMIVVVWIVN